MVGEPDAIMQPAPQDNKLMPKHRVLSLKPQLRLEWRGQDGHNETEQPNHSASRNSWHTLQCRCKSNGGDEIDEAALNSLGHAHR
jgi:hypothetical protein